MLTGMPVALTASGIWAVQRWNILTRLEAAMREILLSLPMAQAIASFPEPVGVVVGGLVSTLAGDEVLDGEGSGLAVLVSLGGVLVGSEAGVLEGRTLDEDLGLHREVARFFLATPWWFASCLAKWSERTETARVCDGAREQRRIANVDSANMLRSLMAGISSRVVKRREREIKSGYVSRTRATTRKRERNRLRRRTDERGFLWLPPLR